jgi:hypothetical protein
MRRTNGGVPAAILRGSSLLGCAIALGCATQGPPRPYSQEQLLRNWALSHCLSLSGSDRSASDAARAAEEYRAMGSAGREVYERIDELAQTYLERGYAGARRDDLDTMKCIDLYNSPELQAIAEDGSTRRSRGRDRDRDRDRERSRSSRY